MLKKREPEDGTGIRKSVPTTTVAETDMAAPMEMGVKAARSGLDGTIAACVAASAMHKIKVAGPRPNVEAKNDSRDDVEYDDVVRASISRLSTAVEALMANHNAMLATRGGLELQRSNIDAERTLNDVNNSCNIQQGHKYEPCKYTEVRWANKHEELKCAEEMGLYQSHLASKIYQRGLEDVPCIKMGDFSFFTLKRIWDGLHKDFPVT